MNFSLSNLVKKKYDFHFPAPTKTNIEKFKEKEIHVEKAFEACIKEWDAGNRWYYTQIRPFHQSLARRKPGVVHYKKDQPANSINVVFIGSFKKFTRQFSNADKGQLVDHLRVLIIVQKRKSGSAFGYITNGIRIQYFAVHMDFASPNSLADISVQSSRERYLCKQDNGEPPELADGGKLFLRLLANKDYNMLGYELPTIKFDGVEAQFKNLVGQGSFGKVFEQKDGKLIKLHQNEEHLTKETENLKKLLPYFNQLTDRNFTFTKYLSVSDGGNALLIEPKGIQFAKTLKDHATVGSSKQMMQVTRHLILDLVEAIKFLHESVKYVHRDIKLSNIFALESDRGPVNRPPLRYLVTSLLLVTSL